MNVSLFDTPNPQQGSVFKEIPAELQGHIFLQLEPKFLHLIGAVCKLWFNAIHDPQFIHMKCKQLKIEGLTNTDNWKHAYRSYVLGQRYIDKIISSTRTTIICQQTGTLSDLRFYQESQVISSSWGGVVKLWDVEKKQCLQECYLDHGSHGFVSKIEVIEDRLFACCSNGKLKSFDLDSWKPIDTSINIEVSSLSLIGKDLLFGGVSGDIHYFSIEQDCLVELYSPPNKQSAITLCETHGRQIVTASSEKWKIEGWDLRASHKTFTLEELTRKKGKVSSIALEGQYLATSFSHSWVDVYDLRKKETPIFTQEKPRPLGIVPSYWTKVHLRGGILSYLSSGLTMLDLYSQQTEHFLFSKYVRDPLCIRKGAIDRNQTGITVFSQDKGIVFLNVGD